MLIVLSPAKSLDFSAPPVQPPMTAPGQAKETAKLVSAARKLSRADLAQMMDISDKLADLTHARFKAFRAEPDPAAIRPAMLAFAGDVYEGLKARTLDLEGLQWAQDHVRILSGLYGVLRPLDQLQPYRLEMGVRVPGLGSLYDFWGDRIAKTLRAALDGQVDPTLVNLASQEYFGAVDVRALKRPVVSCVFLQERDGARRNLGLFSKVARGLMARFAIDNRLEATADLKAFDRANYRYRADLSTESEWTFIRPQPALGTPMAVSEA